ncbi:hypothetical protein YB2330_006186, partial [Saitoella coloradoensis]
GHIKPECSLPPLDVQEKATRRLRAGGFDTSGEARTGGINLNKESYMVEAMRTRDVPEGNFLVCLDGEDAALERGTVGTEPVSGKEVSQGELDEAVRKIRESYLIEARRKVEVFAAEANPRKRVHIEDLVNDEDEPMEIPQQQKAAKAPKKKAVQHPIKGMVGVPSFDLIGAMKDPTLGPHMSYMQYLNESPRGRALLLNALKSSRLKVVRKKKVAADGMHVASAYAVDGYAVDGSNFPGAKPVEMDDLVPKTFMAMAKVNGTPIELVIDGGSMVNLMHQSEVAVLGLTFIEDDTMSIRVADGRWIALKGYAEALVTVSSVTKRVKFWILHTRKSYRALLSKSWLIQCRAWASFEDDYHILRGKDDIGHVVAPVGGIVPTRIPDVSIHRKATTQRVARSYEVISESDEDSSSEEEESSSDDYDLDEGSEADCFIIEVARTVDVRRMEKSREGDISSITVEVGSIMSATDSDPDEDPDDSGGPDGDPYGSAGPEDFPTAAISPLVATKLRAALGVEGVSVLSRGGKGSEAKKAELDVVSGAEGMSEYRGGTSGSTEYEALAESTNGVVEREVSTGRIRHRIGTQHYPVKRRPVVRELTQASMEEVNAWCETMEFKLGALVNTPERIERTKRLTTSFWSQEQGRRGSERAIGVWNSSNGSAKPYR